MLKLSFKTLADTYAHYNAFDTAALYQDLGWDDLVNAASWANTCAVRMSLALLACGVRLEGRLKVKKGNFKGKWVEPGQNDLSNWLVRHHGSPEEFPYDPKMPTGPATLSGQRGIISFMRIPGYAGGHIDLLDASAKYLACSRACYFTADTVRFWKVV